MKLIVFSCFLLFIVSCNSGEDLAIIEKCLSQINNVGSEQTFREAIPVAERMVKEHPTSARLKFRLADFYLLEYLVDNKEEGITKAQQQITEAIQVDPSLRTMRADLKKDAEFLMEFKQIWEVAVTNGDKNEIENLLIWALVEHFDEKSELNRINNKHAPTTE